MSTTFFTTCVCLSPVRKGISSATVKPCTLLLLLIWYTNFVLCSRFAKQLYFSHCSPRKVCICSSDVWHCFLVCGCDYMQHVPCKVFTLPGHPTQVVCICEPNNFPNRHFPSSCEFANVYKLHTSLQTLADTHRWIGVTTLHLRLASLCTC